MNPTAAAVDPKEPWPGLQSYAETDAGIFFGREKEIAELLRLVRREVLTIVFGPSGTGKTSLLQAGIFPQLRQTGYLPIAVRLDHSAKNPDYVGQTRRLLDQAITRLGLEVEVRSPLPDCVCQPASTLWEYLHGIVLWDARNQPVTPVLAFDQFEEIFTLAKDGESARVFLAELADLVENYIPIRVQAQLEGKGGTIPFSGGEPSCRFILSLREDFLWQLDGLRKAMPSVMHNRFLLSHMNREQAFLAVTGPGAGIVDETVARHIVSFVAAEEAQRSQNVKVDPSLLSVVCRELNNRRIESGRSAITEDLLERSRSGILNDFYERGFAGLEPAARIFVEDRLLTQSGLRGTVPVEEASASGLSDEQIRTLESRRLIRVEERLGIPHVELIHDVLTGVAQQSRTERRHREREESLRRAIRQRRRRQWTAAAVFIIVLAAILGIAGEYVVHQDQQLRAASDVESRAALEEMKLDDTAASFAYLAEAMRNNSGNETAVALTLDDIRDFLLPALVLDHKDEVREASFSPDGSRVLTASLDGSAQVWDAKTGQAIGVPMRHCGVGEKCPVPAAEFNADGTKVVTASSDGTARVWDARTGKPLLDAPLRPGSGTKVYAAKFSPDSLRIVTAADAGDGKGVVQIWDAQTGKQMAALQHDKTVWTAAFNYTGTLVVSASADHTARVWEPTGGKTLVLQHADEVNFAAFSPDSKWIVTASDDQTAQVWDARTGRRIGETMRHGAPVNFAGFSPDSQFVVTASSDHTARIWDAMTGKEIGEPMRHDNWVRSATFSPDGRTVVTASYDRTARVWDARTGLALGEPLRHSGTVYMARFANDNSSIVTASFNHTAQIWKWQPVRNFPVIRQAGVMKSAFLTGDDKYIAAVSTQGVEVWDARTGQAITGIARNGSDEIKAAHFSPDGKWLLTTTAGAAQVWTTADGKPAGPAIPFGDLEYAALTLDGRRMATASADEVQLWESQSGRPVWTRPLHSEGALAGIGFSPDGRTIVTYTHQGTVNLWDAGSGKPTAKTMKHGARVFSATFSPDSKWLVTTSADREAIIWDAQTGQVAGDKDIKMKHDSWVLDGEFSIDGKWIVTASADKTARIWDAQTHEPGAPPLAQKGAVNSVRFSPDGQSFVTLSEDGIAQVWDVRTGFETGKAIGTGESIVDVNFSADGKWLVTTSKDGTARMRELFMTTTKAPSWLADTAEALGGSSFDKLGRLQSATQDPAGLRERLSHVPGNDDIARFGRWLAADPAKRPLSPKDN